MLNLVPLLLSVRNTRDELVRKEDLAEGNEKIRQIATNLLKKDFSIEEIVEITGLSEEETENLK